MRSKQIGREEEQHPSRTQLSDLSALADGSLDPIRRPAIEQWIAGSPRLRMLYQRERAAVAVLHRVAAERAPARLRMRAALQRASRAPGRA